MATIEENYLNSRLQKVERINDILIHAIETEKPMYNYQNYSFLYGHEYVIDDSYRAGQTLNLITGIWDDDYDPAIEGKLPIPLNFVCIDQKYYLNYYSDEIELFITNGEPRLIQTFDFTACYQLELDGRNNIHLSFYYNLPLDISRKLNLGYNTSDHMPNIESLIWFASGPTSHPITLCIIDPNDRGRQIIEQGFIYCQSYNNQSLIFQYGGAHGVIELTYESHEESDEVSTSYNLISNVNWDNYINPYFNTDSSDDNEGGYSIHYKLCPPQEEDPANFPPESWPTHKTLEGDWDFSHELRDTYYTVIGVGGACTVNNVHQITDIWDDITIYVKADAKL